MTLPGRTAGAFRLPFFFRHEFWAGSPIMKRPYLAHFLLTTALIVCASFFPSPARAQAQGTPQIIEIETQEQLRPFPHYWEQMFGSGRAILSLRESYRNDLRAVKKITDFQ